MTPPSIVTARRLRKGDRLLVTGYTLTVIRRRWYHAIAQWSWTAWLWCRLKAYDLIGRP